VKNKKLLILFLALFFLLQSGGFAVASEVIYFPIPGLETPQSDCSGSNCLSILVAYWFGLMIYIAGFIAIISLAVGAVILMVSGDNPERSQDAKDRIKGSILGLILTICSFLIIRTIDPTLIEVTTTPLPAVDGIFYTNNTEDKPCPIENPNTSTIEKDFKNIKYKCDSGPALLIWEFPKKNYKGNNNDYSGVNVRRVLCGSVTPISGLSFKLAFETDGVYYCMEGCNGSMCRGYMSNAISNSQDQIPSPFNGKVKGIRVVNNSSNYYGVILHQENNATKAGVCSYPIINQHADTRCQTIDFSVASIDVFKWNNDNIKSPSGSSVDFYTEPHGTTLSAQKRGEGFCTIKNSTIKNMFIEMAGNLLFTRTDKDSPDYGCNYTKNTLNQYQEKYDSFASKPGSVIINGNYILAIYEDGEGAGSQEESEKKEAYCQVFKSSIFNTNVQSFFAQDHVINSIYIIPIK